MQFCVLLTFVGQLVLFNFSQASFVGWILGRDSSPFSVSSSGIKSDKSMSHNEQNIEEPPHDISDNSPVEISKIPFELSFADEKFIADAQKYTDLKLSELDVCQHKLILQLKQDCNDLTEDDLSKLGVNLLNCQSKQEGRPIYPCSSSMSLKECTQDMDSDTWNAYHILSNRARSVCYGARQQQFRALTQMTVNKLMASSNQQLEFIQELKAEQEELGDLAVETLGSLTKGQKKLLEHQTHLEATQQLASQQISSTMRQLSRERSVAFASQKQLAIISESLKETLDHATKLAVQQENERQVAQQNLIESLTSIEGHVGDFWNQLEGSVEKLLVQQEHAAHLQSETVQTLQRLNETFQFLLSVSEHSKDQLNWIQGLVANTEKKLGNLSTWVLHACYFLFGMLLLSFGQAPSHTRFIFLMLVPINLSMDLQHGTVMELPALTGLLIILSLGYRCLLYLINRISAYKCLSVRNTPQEIKHICSSTPRKLVDEMTGRKDDELINDCTLIEDDAFEEDSILKSCSNTPLPSYWDKSSNRSLFHDKVEDASFSSLHRRSSRISNSFRDISPPRSITPNQSRSGTPRRPSTPRRNCMGKCIDGSVCRNPAAKDSTFCWQHK